MSIFCFNWQKCKSISCIINCIFFSKNKSCKILGSFGFKRWKLNFTLLMIQCQKSIRFAPQNLHAIFAKRNWKKSISGCINYFKSNPKIRRDSAINGKYGSTKHETWIEQYLLNCIVQFRSQNLYEVTSKFLYY